MKTVIKFALVSAIFVGAILFPDSANCAAIREKAAAKEAETEFGDAEFKDIEGKEWILLEVRSGGKTITMDREKLENDNLSGAFTISFRQGRIGGMGAPNRYNAPYTKGADKSLSIGNIASTRMLAFKEPEGLKEKDFFDYLTSARRWNFSRSNRPAEAIVERLELYSKDPAGNEVILVFELN